MYADTYFSFAYNVEACHDCLPMPETLEEYYYPSVSPCFCEIAPCSSEMEMQRAGRPSDNTFRDLRSARRAHQRSIKRSRKRRTRKQDRIWGYWGYEKNTRRVQNCEDNRHHLQEREWQAEYWYNQSRDHRFRYMDTLEHFSRFGTWGDAKAIGDGEDGEDFSTWGKRRIEEMRRVKENRIRQKQAMSTAKSNLSLPKSTTPSTSIVCRTANVVPTTTLPTTYSDIRGHELLKYVLKPLDHHLKYLRRINKVFFPIVHGFSWFGEYSWAMHRNESGCWEFGREHCGSAALQCLCCWSPKYRCYCEQFEGQASPEDLQRCALVEWAKGELRINLEKQHVLEMAKNAEFDVVSEVEDETWELMSDAASMDWSIVSDPEGSVDAWL